MYPGSPCFFLAEGKCTDYEGRPKTCQSYDCAWKTEPQVFPEWMRPDLVGVIISRIVVPSREDLAHYEVAEANGKLDVRTLNWLIQWSAETGNNVLYQVEGKHHPVGSQTFRREMVGR
jgi:Fe-S-cluster containining protein